MLIFVDVAMIHHLVAQPATQCLHEVGFPNVMGNPVPFNIGGWHLRYFDPLEPRFEPGVMTNIPII